MRQANRANEGLEQKGSTSGNPKAIRLKLMIDKEKNRVLFAESDNDFVDILFGFLTMPMGTLVRLLGPQAPMPIECMGRLYSSVLSLESRHLETETCKTMLIYPRSAAEAECSKLKVKVDTSTEPTKYYMCSYLWVCPYENNRLLTTFRNVKCHCGKVMDREMEVQGSDIAGAGDGDGGEGGIFVKEGATRFMINDNLQVMPASTATCIQLLGKMGIDDGNSIEEKTIDIGADEVLRLLKSSLRSHTPLTDAIWLQRGNSTDSTIESGKKKEKQPLKDRATSINSKRKTMKLLLSKARNIVLFAEAGEDLVDFLFSFLTFPLGSIVKLLDGNSKLGCMDNLYKSVEDLSTVGYIKSKECKDMLVCPKLAPHFGCDNQLLLQIEEDIYPRYEYNAENIHKGVINVVTEAASETSIDSEMMEHLAVMNPKSPTKESTIGGRFMKGPAMFMITDNLFISPLSPVISISLLKKWNVPIKDVEERIVTVGEEEARRLLKASLISQTALSDVFN